MARVALRSLGKSEKPELTGQGVGQDRERSVEWINYRRSEHSTRPSRTQRDNSITKSLDSGFLLKEDVRVWLIDRNRNGATEAIAATMWQH